ncbi:LuxR C-terminal-related transcriptional regulator [Streptomyces sp. NPDC059720]|uniref:LuxR C-terminal-related transcriptional regulator n=1 Tax=Streptomyces sp. NPDC059720 TaxID=3346924 RepID=UPI00369918D5
MDGSAPRREHSLPAETTSFVDRRGELTEGRELLARARMVTLTGPGGVGKTRLAARLAARVQRAFPDGVRIVHLSGLHDPDLVPLAVADALGLHDHSSRPQPDALVEQVRERRLLLVLDNCEHLAAACARLAAALLRGAEGVRILATSRHRLGLTEEHLLQVRPLPVPDPDGDLSAADGCPALTLFADRAAAVVPGFRLTPANRAAVARLCRRLDGLPLAIELAAVRMRVLDAEQLLVRLGDRYRVLTTGSPAALPRHRTLRAAIAWSHDLCTGPEQLAWARLSVLPGTFDLETAESVCADAPGGTDGGAAGASSAGADLRGAAVQPGGAEGGGAGLQSGGAEGGGAVVRSGGAEGAGTAGQSGAADGGGATAPSGAAGGGGAVVRSYADTPRRPAPAADPAPAAADPVPDADDPAPAATGPAPAPGPMAVALSGAEPVSVPGAVPVPGALPASAPMPVPGAPPASAVVSGSVSEAARAAGSGGSGPLPSAVVSGPVPEAAPAVGPGAPGPLPSAAVDPRHAGLPVTGRDAPGPSGAIPAPRGGAGLRRPSLGAADVLDALAGLVDKSVVQREEGAGGVRYRMLDTLREYGLEQLRRVAGEEGAARRRQRDHLLRRVEAYERGWFGPGQPEAVARLRADLDGLRAALDFSLSTPGEALTGLRLAGTLWFYWHACGASREGLHWLDRALAACPEPTRERARGLWVAGLLAAATQDLPRGRRHAAGALALARALGDAAEAAHAEYVIGVIRLFGDDLPGALHHFEATVARGPVPGQHLSLAGLDQVELACALGFLGEADRAVEVCERTLRLCERHGEQWVRSYVTRMLALAHTARGDWALAERHAREALRLKIAVHDVIGMALTLDLLASVAAERGAHEHTAVLLGGADRVWARIHAGRWDSRTLNSVRGRSEELASRALGREAFDRAHRRGGGLPLPDLTGHALQEPGRPHPVGPDGERPPQDGSSVRLTRRENEVARLVAEGLANQQIADRLVIARRTAEGHVERILSKLGFSNRSQIAAWVTAQR